MSELTEAIRLQLDEVQQRLYRVTDRWVTWTCPDCGKGYVYSAVDEVATDVLKPCGGSGLAVDHDAQGDVA